MIPEIQVIGDQAYFRVKVKPMSQGGGYVAFTYGYPGCLAQGETPIDVIEDIKKLAAFFVLRNVP